MAQHAGDKEAEAFHAALLTRIRKGFFDRLWVERLGHPGKYREQGGHRRLHEDPWLYSIFLPIDAGLLSPEQAATTLNYALTSLQNDRKASGGRMVWNSNWVPAIWSTRVDWPGDNYALALAYFQTGFGEDGWDVFQGTFSTGAYDLACPGNLGHKAGGYDFGDCSHTFTRTLVEGLFGYNPDYPKDLVRLRPQFPRGWTKANISIPDVSLSYSMVDQNVRYQVSLAVPARIDIQIPIYAENVTGVSVDGIGCEYKLAQGINSVVICLLLSSRRSADVSISFAQALVPVPALQLNSRCDDMLTIAFEDCEILSIPDPQRIFQKSEIAQGKFQGHVTDNIGRHLLLAEVRIGTTCFRRPVHLTVNPKAGEKTGAAICLAAPAPGTRWRMIDLTSTVNCDIRSIFKQRYLSPRPNTVSARLGLDGWTPWTSTFWGQKPPLISLEYVPSLLNSSGALVTPQGAHFSRPGNIKNIALTSLWDNFPQAIAVPIGVKGESIWLMIAGSTNSMQCHIANAAVRLQYSDDVNETLELIPPINFWALAPLCISGSAAGQEGRHDYSNPQDAFCVPRPYPNQVNLGTNCRAMIYGLKLRPDAKLNSITLEALSQEVVIGLMAVSIAF